MSFYYFNDSIERVVTILIPTGILLIYCGFTQIAIILFYFLFVFGRQVFSIALINMFFDWENKIVSWFYLL